MFLGGGLNSHKTYKKILSIGYEFETHSIAKLSLHDNKTSLINSDLALRIIPDKIRKGSIKVLDDAYLFVRIPIEHEGDLIKSPNSKSLSASSKSKSADAKNEEYEQEYKEEYKEEYGENEDEDENGDLHNEYENAFNEDEEMDDLEEEFMEAFAEEQEIEELNKRENDSYLELLNEYRKKDNKKIFKFQVTNDIGEGDFEEMISKQCEHVKTPKNDMFYFKTKGGKIFDLKFSERLRNSCQTFSGVEYVVTYYKPKKHNPNIIIETFLDSCSRIIDHLGNLEKTMGTLLIKTGKDSFERAGNLDGNRKLYHKPGTNIFYIDTYDDKSWKLNRRAKTIADFSFIPQMTFRCNACDMMDILREMVAYESEFKIGKRNIRDIQTEYDDLIKIENVIDQLIADFNKTAKRKILLKSIAGRTIKSYVFLILYKLFCYIQFHVYILFRDDYLKDYIGFSSRHGNTDLYVRFKELMKTHYGISDHNEITEFFNKPAIMKPFYDFERMEDEDFNEDGEYIYGEPLTEILKKGDKNYGDPMYSYISYFKYFENPEKKSENDWMVASKLDLFSNTFDLANDEILIENRFFKAEIATWLRNKVDRNIRNSYLTIKDMYSAVNAYYDSRKMKNIMTLELDNDKKLTKKCKKGFKRDSNFECVKKKRKTVKRNRKSH